MQKSYLFIFLCCFWSNVFAQSDSVKNQLQQKQVYFADSAQTAVYNFAKYSPLFINELMPNQISRIAVGHQLEQGKFMTAQASTKTNTAFLSSDGTIVLNGIKFYGAFAYQKVFEDSTRFAHQTRNNTTTPYYYGSPAYNHYERSIYDFKAMASKSFLNDKFVAGLGLDYHIADHFSNNDPRGSLKEYQLNTKVTAGYNLNKNFQVGLGFILGYGQETVTIGYKNRRYYETTAYPNYTNYLINGYGEPTPKITLRKYDDLQNRLGFDFNLKLLNTELGSFYFNGSQVEEKQSYIYKYDKGIDQLSNYNISRLNLNLLWTKPINSGVFSTEANYENWAGDDFNAKFSAKNYVFTRNQLQLRSAYSVKKGNHLHNYNFSAIQLAEERIDGITGNKVYFKNILLNIGYGLQQKLADQKSIGFSLGLHYGTSLADEFAVGTSIESYFTRLVIFHDYLYHTASKYGGSVAAEYNFPFFKIMQGGVKLNLDYTVKDDLKTIERTLTSIPGQDRFYSNLSFNLYF